MNGADLLDQARSALTTYCALPTPEAADAVVLWCAATHALPTLPFAPRLSVRSATKRAGKSRVLEVVAALSNRPLKTVNATVAAIFRSLNGDHPPTLIFDEADTLFGSRKVAENNEDLRGLLNAGFERGNPSIRCVGPLQVPTEFPSFAMAALAGIGSLPDTIEDRSVVIHMKRRKSTETVKPFRIRRDRPPIEHIGEELGVWLASEDARQQLVDAEPMSDLEDRQADVWESLLLVADLAGHGWPARARTAAERLCDESAQDEQEVSLPVHLLHDLRDVLKEDIKSDFALTELLLIHLKAIKDSPWAEMDLTGHRLGAMLRNFGIRSQRDTAGKKRGYRKVDFADAFERYPAPQPSEASKSVNVPPDQVKQPDTSSDASVGATKASDKVSAGSRSSGPILTVADASDGHGGEDRCRACQRPQPEWVLEENDGRCVRCAQDRRLGKAAS